MNSVAYSLESLKRFDYARVEALYLSGAISESLYRDYQWVWCKSCLRFSTLGADAFEHKPSFAAKVLLEDCLQAIAYREAIKQVARERWEMRL